MGQNPEVMRALIRFVLAASIVVALASCGEDEELADTAPAPSPIETEIEEVVESPEPEEPEEPEEEEPEEEEPPYDDPAPYPTAGLPTPRQAALHFYDDWHAQDESAASGYATQDAIDELFSHQPSNMEFMGCSEEGDYFSCFFYYEGGGMNMTIVDTDAYGHVVTDIGYVAD